jgi:hypothetical protein
VPRSKWKLTQRIIDEVEVDEWGDAEPVLGLRVIRLLDDLARDPDNGLRRLDSGVYLGPPPP